MRADVFAAAAFEHEPHADLGRGVLVEVEGGRAGPDVGAVVLAGDRVHGVLPQEPLLRGQLHGLARGLLEAELVVADGAIHIENDAAGVLADGLRLVLRQGDVLLDDLHRAGGDGALLLAFERIEDGLMHVVRDFRRGAADEFQQRILQHIHRPKAKRERNDQVNWSQAQNRQVMPARMR